MLKPMKNLIKIVFRRDLGSLTDAYEIILAKLGGSNMYKVKVFVTLRESVLDPQGTAVMDSFIL